MSEIYCATPSKNMQMPPCQSAMNHYGMLLLSIIVGHDHRDNRWRSIVCNKYLQPPVHLDQNGMEISRASSSFGCQKDNLTSAEGIYVFLGYPKRDNSCLFRHSACTRPSKIYPNCLPQIWWFAVEPLPFLGWLAAPPWLQLWKLTMVNDT